MTQTSTYNILYSCVDERMRSNEQFVPEHAFGIILAGEAHFHSPHGTEIYKEGTMGFIRRNQLLKTIKVPPAEGAFKSINVVFDQDFLRRYAAQNGIEAKGRFLGEGRMEMKPNPFLKGYFDSLVPYFDHPEQINVSMAKLKIEEALELLLKTHPHTKEILFDFSEPFKIDIDAFMNQHYTYNVSLAQFAKLTGRSLATFKRDFQKIFASPPEKWLQHKRLEHAHFLISQRGQAPSEASLEVGFANLSHFSYAFKNFFGYNPSSLR